MAKRPKSTLELSELGRWLFQIRTRRGLTQRELSAQSGIAQPRLSNIEQGRILPTLRQLLRLSRVLGVPLQWFLRGGIVPGEEMRDIALELRHLGVSDLIVPDAAIPGAFRPVEQVIVLAVAGNQPEPRIIEAMPAVLSW